MEEDWGKTANAPNFCLFKQTTPEEAAFSDSMVDIITYNQWSKQERRLYRRLKTQKLAEMFETRQKEELNDIADILAEQLVFLKETETSKAEDQKVTDTLIDDLIAKVDQLRFSNEANKHKNRE